MNRISPVIPYVNRCPFCNGYVRVKTGWNSPDDHGLNIDYTTTIKCNSCYIMFIIKEPEHIAVEKFNQRMPPQ